MINLSDQHTYLGVSIHKHLSWTPHITGVVAKASKTLNFLKRNLSKTSRQVKEFAYLTMVRPQLEYALDFWDPYHVEDITELEKVQRRAAHWVLNDYGRYSFVTSMLEQLSWPSLQLCCKSSRLQSLHKALYHQISLAIPPYFLPMSRSTRQYHPLHYILPQPSTTAYQYSYFYRMVNDWNKLPLNLIELTDTDSFINELQSLL